MLITWRKPTFRRQEFKVSTRAEEPIYSPSLRVLTQNSALAILLMRNRIHPKSPFPEEIDALRVLVKLR